MSIFKVSSEFRDLPNTFRFKHGLTLFELNKPFNVVSSQIEELFNYKTLSNNYSDIVDFLEYHQRDVGDDIHRYQRGRSLNGILSFDKILKRFVIFHFTNIYDDRDVKFVKMESFIHSKLKESIENILESENEDYKIDLLSKINLNEVNFELSKIIVLSNLIPTKDLLEYINGDSKSIELWRIGEVGEDITFIEKIQNDYSKEETITFSEKSLLDYSGITDSIKRQYLLFKEILNFRFRCSLEIKEYIDVDSIYSFFNETFKQLNYIERIDDSYQYEDLSRHWINSNPDSVQVVLNDFIDNLKREDPKLIDRLGYVNSIQFFGIKILLISDIKFLIQFNLKFYEDRIKVLMYPIVKNQDDFWLPNEHSEKFEITKLSNYNTIEICVDRIFDCYNNYLTNKKVTKI